MKIILLQLQYNYNLYKRKQELLLRYKCTFYGQEFILGN